MRVEKVMAIMKGGGSIKGRVLVECVGGRCVLSVKVHDVDYDNIVLMLDNKAYILPRRGERYRLDGESENIRVMRCVLIDSTVDEIVAYGSNNMTATYDDLMGDYHEAISHNSTTYDGVSGENGAHDQENSAPPIDGDTPSPSDSEDMPINETNESIAVGDAPSSASEDIESPKVDAEESQRSFYAAISRPLEELFRRYEREKALEDMIGGSRFAKIFYSDDSYYVVGDIKNGEGEAELICYGYPGEGGDTPPSGVECSYEWLPLSRDDTHGKGYYMMYQNAITGDIIEN